MENTITRLAEFVDRTEYETLPEEAAHEAGRLLLDTVGCALSGMKSDKGRWGIDYARMFFSGNPQATVLGFGDRMSAMGAVFANAEMINGLDYDAAGKHLPPFVVPGCLAVAEMNHASGKELINAAALAFEVGIRVGKALGSYRDIRDDKTSLPPVTGHSSAVFGGAAGVAKLSGMNAAATAQALSMAGLISPVQTQTPMHKDLPTTSCKYVLAGWAAQTSLTAPYLIRAGHRGDLNVLDGEYGYWRFTGSTRWNPESVVDRLGEKWVFIRNVPIKQYPCCRMMHGGLDCLTAIVREQKLRPEEIEGIHVYLEATCEEPLFHNPVLENQIDAQFNVRYNMAVAASGIRPGLAWQEKETLRDPAIRALMEKVSFEPHPSYVNALKKNADSRISGARVTARGQVFYKETSFIKGTNTDDPATAINDRELKEKFLENAGHVLPAGQALEAYEMLADLENVRDVNELLPVLCTGRMR